MSKEIHIGDTVRFSRRGDTKYAYNFFTSMMHKMGFRKVNNPLAKYDTNRLSNTLEKEMQFGIYRMWEVFAIEEHPRCGSKVLGLRCTKSGEEIVIETTPLIVVKSKVSKKTFVEWCLVQEKIS